MRDRCGERPSGRSCKFFAKQANGEVSQRGFGTSSEYLRELIRKEQDRLQLRELLLEGAKSSRQEQWMRLTSTTCAAK
jgi:hypothetical protein